MMANKPLRPCNKTGCPNLTRERFCEEHKQVEKKTFNFTNEQKKEYDKKRNGTTARKLYDHKWREYRKEFLKRNPNCKQCGAPATVIDHVIPHKGNVGLFWTRFNHMALCKTCHDRKTGMYDGGFGNQIRPK